MNTGRLSVLSFLIFLVAVVGINIGLTEGGGATMAIAFAALGVLSFVYAMYLGPSYRLEVTKPGHGPFGEATGREAKIEEALAAARAGR